MMLYDVDLEDFIISNDLFTLSGVYMYELLKLIKID